jgi:hypothetical protein
VNPNSGCNWQQCNLINLAANPNADCIESCKVEADICPDVCEPGDFSGPACFSQNGECGQCFGPIMHGNYGCGPWSASMNLTPICLRLIQDWPNPGTGRGFTAKGDLIKREDYCSLISTNSSSKSYYCSFNNTWVETNTNLSHKSVVPQSLLIHMISLTQNRTGNNNVFLTNSSCCLQLECWDPNVGSCIPEQGAAAFYQVNDAVVYKCLQGSWINVLGGNKKTPDACYSGFCPEQNQCLFNIAGSVADNGNPDDNPQCLNDKQFKGDYVCANGSWDTRTRMLAIKMIDLVGSANAEFKLSCGKIDEELNAKQNPGASDTFCVLSKGGSRIIGTFLNQPFVNTAAINNSFIDSVKQSFWFSYPSSGAEFDTAYTCTAASKDFALCLYAKTASKDLLRVYYDSTSSIAVMSTIDLSPTISQTICNALPSWLQWLCPAQSQLKEQLAKLGAIEKLYSVKTASKQAFGYGMKNCDSNHMIIPVWSYYFNYSSGFSDTELMLLRSGIVADYLSINGTVVKIINPLKGDVWDSLSALKHQ